MIGQIFSQAKKLKNFLALLYVLPLLFLVAVVVASRKTGVPLTTFTRDPVAVAGLSPFTGVASNLGAIFWSATAAICLFSWIALRSYSNESKLATFLLCSGLITTLLLLDDFFLLHESFFPKYLGMSEKVVVLCYGLLVLAWIVIFRKFILRTEYLILAVAFAFFGASLCVDVFQYPIERLIGDWRILLEDGFKLLGIVGWLGYFSRCGLMAVSP